MKGNLKNRLAILFILSLFTIVSCNQSGDHTTHQNTEEVLAKEEVKIVDLSKLMKSPNQVVIASVKTVKGELKLIDYSIEAVGVVTYDTRKTYSIPSRVAGRIEKTYLKYEFQLVKKGQKIAEIYSPELITAQRELLYLIESDSVNQQIISAAKSKLQLLGLSDSQINNLTKRKETNSTFAIYSPYDGYLVMDNSVPSSSIAMPQSSASAINKKGGMNNMSSSPSSAQSSTSNNTINNEGSLLSEGNYVQTGQTLFQVINTDAVRIELDVAVTRSGAIKVGDKIELDFGNGEKELALIGFVQPFFNEGQNFLKIRVYTKKIKGLHIGHLVKAKISEETKQSLWVPKESVLNLGTFEVVFVKDSGVFKPKRVITGIKSGKFVAIKSGLVRSEEIAVNAQYLVDSESFIKPAN